MKKTMKKALAALLAAALTLSLTACGSGSDATTAAPAGAGVASSASGDTSGGTKGEGAAVSAKDTLNIGINKDNGTLAPVYNSQNPGYAIYETLYMVDYNTEEYQMMLAESAETTDSTHMTVKLKDGITDSAGNPLKASDVVYSLQYATTDTISAMYVAYIDMEATHAVDDLTVEIVLKETNVQQWYQLGDVRIFTQAAMEASSDGMVNTPVGTGPYKVTEYISGSSIKMEARDDYWGEAPAIKYVNWIVISENSQRAIALESGEIDLCLDTAASDYMRFEGQEGYGTYVRHLFRNAILEFNCSEYSIMKDVKVRQAVAYAVDSNAVLSTVFNGLGEVSNGATSNACAAFDPTWNNEYYPYNVEKAKALLTEAGIAEGTHVTIGNNGTTVNSMIAEVVQSFLLAVGLDAEIMTYDNATWSSVRQDANCGLDICVQVYSSPDGYYAGEIWSGVFSSGTNHYENEELYHLISEAMATVDTKKQLELNKQINHIMVSEVPGYGLVDMSNLYVWNASLAGVEEMALANTRVIPNVLYFK